MRNLCGGFYGNGFFIHHADIKVAAGEAGEFHDDQGAGGNVTKDTRALCRGSVAGQPWIMFPGLVRGDIHDFLSAFPSGQVKRPGQAYGLFP